jgi:chromosomal replication initiation ATPase DnaA
MKTQQLLLNLELPTTFDASDFIVGSCNADAYTWIMRWPDWPTHTLAIYGPTGCGKSHLATIWQQKSQAHWVSSQAIPAPTFFRPGRAIIVEGQPVDVRAYLHLYNYVRENKGYILLIDHEPPARWSISLPDLRSRLLAVPALEIAHPDETVLAAVCVKLFTDQQIKVSPECIEYMLPRVERSFKGVSSLVSALGKYSLERQKSITIPLIRHVLEHSHN